MTLASYIFFAEPEDRMDAILASRKERKRMLDEYEMLGEMATSHRTCIVFLEGSRDRFGPVRALLMHETGVYADEMGELMGLTDKPDGGLDEILSVSE